MPRRLDTVAAVAAVQMATGFALATRPAAAVRVVAGRVEPDRVATVVRVLGGRMLVQGVLEFLRPRPGVAVAGAAVDGSHALSMLALAAASGRYRRPALASAALAGGCAAALALAARRAGPR